jgi:hypothetical protein
VNAALLAFVLVAACAGPSVQVDWNRDTDFSAYRSFAFAPRDEAARESAHPLAGELVRLRIQAAVAEALETRGYAEDEFSEGDLWVRFRLHFERTSDVVGYKWGGDPWSDLERDDDWWVYDDEELTDLGRYTHEYETATILVDVFDAALEQPVWRGWTSTAAGDPEGFAERVPEAIQALFERFPPAALY